MSDEIDNPEEGAGQPEERHEGAQQPKYEDRIAELATKVGWKPTGPLSAEDFLATMPDRFHGQGKELKALKRSIDGITATVSQVAQQKYDEGIRDAEKRLAAAKADYDPDAVEAATVALERAKAAKANVQPQAEPVEVTEFIERNPWFESDRIMRTDALEYREKFLKTNPDAGLDEMLEYVERKIKKDYPEKFAAKEEKSERKPPAAGPEGVKSSASQGKEKWEVWEKDLSDFERNTMNAYCSQTHNGKPLMTKKQYIESLAQSGRFGR